MQIMWIQGLTAVLSYSSKGSHTGIIMQREDIILEWIFFTTETEQEIKNICGKGSGVISKRKIETPSISWNRSNRNYSAY